MRKDRQRIEVKKCQRSLIIDAITEVRRNTPGKGYLFNREGRGINLKDFNKYEDNIVCLSMDGLGFPVDEIL